MEPIDYSDPMIKQASATIDNIFSTVVGQNKAKARVKNLLLGAIAQKGFLAPMGFIAPPGFGKTRFLACVKEAIRATMGKDTSFGKRVIAMESGSETGTPATFFEDVLVQFFHQGDSVMLIDEFHECPKGVANYVRSCLEPTANRTSKEIKRGDLQVSYNPEKSSIIISTNKIDQLDPALITRLEMIDLEPYSDEEMEQILFDGLKDKGVQFNPNTLRSIAECLRGSARDAVKWINNIRALAAIHGKRSINREDVLGLIKAAGIFPRGVTQRELKTLIILERDGEQQLRELACKTGCNSAEQVSFEMYLYQKNLLTVEGKRRITQHGREYLKELRELGFIPQLPEKNS